MRTLAWASRVTVLILTMAALVGLGTSFTLAQQIPPTPDPVVVNLDASSTAVIVNDINEQICRPQPNCAGAVVPAIVSLLARARDAGALVVFSSAGGSPILPEVGPEPGEPVVAGLGQDRFFSSTMDDVLRTQRISNTIVVGWKANGSVLYTSFGAGIRRYTVVVPVDATSAATEAEAAIGRFQLLDQLGGNATNQPMVRGRVTLSRTDLITFE